MACQCDDPVLAAEIAACNADLANIRTALNALLTGAQSYTLDTGQTRQVVTRADLGQLRLMRQAVRNEIRMLENECCGGAVTRVIPGF